VFGRRLDGWTNPSHPTEAVPGDRGTLPPGADPNEADLDYTGDIMPPPGSAVPALTEDEKMLFARWIDLGCPISDEPDDGWFMDDLRPTLTVASPRPGVNPDAIEVLRIGAYDYYSGIAPGSLSVVADLDVDGKPAGTELAPLFRETHPGVWELALGAPLATRDRKHLRVRVRDQQGNWTEVVRTFSTD
jgi:hypothetical protein